MQISGFTIANDNVISIENFKLTKKRNNHSYCSFVAHVYEKDKDTFMGKVGKDLTVQVKSGDSDEVVFFGVINEIVLHENFHQTMVEVHAASYSLLNDEKFHWRIFQNPDKTLDDIVKEFKLEKGQIDVGQLKDKKFPRVVVQNQETDFVFLQRLAKYCDSFLWVKDSSDGKECGFVLGENSGEKDSNIKAQDIRKVMRLSGRKVKGLTIVTKTYCPCGSKVRVDEYGAYIVTSLLLEKQRGIDVFAYELEEIDSRNQEKIEGDWNQKTVKLLAKVTDNKDTENKTRVKVHFLGQQLDGDGVKDEIEDNASKDKQLWIPYRTPYSGKECGIVFLPDVGDLVEIIITNEECYAVSAYRKQALKQECQQVDDKYIGNNTEQRIFWKKESLELKSYENSVVLDKDKIEMKVADSMITMTKDLIQLKVKDNVFVLETKDAKLKLNGSFNTEAGKDFIVKTSGKCNLQAQGDAIIKGSGVTIKADGTVNLNGGKVNIS